MDAQFLLLDEVLEIHTQQIRMYGGSEGIRDRAGLESAIATAMATFDGQYLHPTLPAMAAAYLFHICRNHPFVDGNKRTGANAAVAFLLMNDWDLDLTESELVELVIAVASSVMTKNDLIRIFEERSRPAASRGRS